MARKCARLLWKEERNNKVGLVYPLLKHKFIKEFLWIDGLCNPSCIHEELRRREAQAEKALEGTSFVALLKACAKNKDLCTGSRIHDDIRRSGLLETCCDALVTMYAKCGALVKAQELLDTHKSTNVFTWNALIAGYAQNAQGQDALRCFERMKQEGLPPDVVTFTCILKACGSIRALDVGEQIHDEIAKQGLLANDVLLGNALVSMYAKCGALKKARKVLEKLPVRNIVSWNALITGYAQGGEGEHALNCYEAMLGDGLCADCVTFLCVLKACGSIEAVDMGEKIHDEIAKQGLLQSNIVLCNALVDMYAKCGALAKARQVLEECPARNVVSWNALIAGYAQHDEGEQALNCFEVMQREGLSPDAATFTCILKACGSIGAADKGEKIHDEIAKQGLLGANILLGTALVDMYAKCGALTKARQVLEELPVRDVISWNALISGCVQWGEGEQALKYFKQMQHEGLYPNAVTFICILKAFGNIRAAEKGEKIHDEIAKQGLLRHDIALGNALVDMYAKCGALAKARQVLEELPIRNVISWSTLIGGYAQHGEGEQALNCFEQMKREGLYPNAVTFICILKACSSIGAADKGEKLHDELAKQGLLANDIVLGNALVAMYAKCGALVKARQVLEELPVRDAISWNALIAGSVQKGEGEQALNWFKQMQHEGLSPDAATFSCLLNACSRLSLVEDAEMYFVKMSTKYGMKPDIGHYTCLVDLFGRAGHLDKAVEVIEKMPSYDTGVWSALLGSCLKWGDVNIGRWAFDRAIQVDQSDAAHYVLMANIYAAAGMQEDADTIVAMRIKNEVCMKPVQSWSMDMCGNPCSSCFGDTKDTQSNQICAKRDDYAHTMSHENYFPSLHWVSQNISAGAKRDLVCAL